MADWTVEEAEDVLFRADDPDGWDAEIRLLRSGGEIARAVYADLLKERQKSAYWRGVAEDYRSRLMMDSPTAV